MYQIVYFLPIGGVNDTHSTGRELKDMNTYIKYTAEKSGNNLYGSIN